MSFPDSIALSYAQAFSTSATKAMPLGTRGTLPDGRVFRYAKAGSTALIAGNACIQAAYSTNNTLHTSNNAQFTAGDTYSTTWSVLPIGGSWSGTSGGFTADQYADGWLLVGSTYGSGIIQQLRIKSHTAHDGGTSNAGDSRGFITLEEGEYPKWAITSSAGAALLNNPYDGVLIATTIADLTGAYVGVSPVAVTEAYYFWCQTWGECAMRVADAATSATVAGAKVINSVTAATTGVCSMGSSDYAANGQEAIGILMSPTAEGGYGIVRLMISP